MSNTLTQLESLISAGQARVAAANRYPMRIRPTRSGTVGVTISGTEYVMTVVELRALRDLVVEGIGRVVGC